MSHNKRKKEETNESGQLDESGQLNESGEDKGTVYLVDGKEWIVGETKISKWSKARVNKIEIIKEIVDQKEEK